MKELNRKEKIIKEMNDILAELSSLHQEDITDENYRQYYEEAANELEHEESEDGELDLFKFTYEHGSDYVGLRNELTEMLKEEGLTLEERRAFRKEHLIGNK